MAVTWKYIYIYVCTRKGNRSKGKQRDKVKYRSTHVAGMHTGIDELFPFLIVSPRWFIYNQLFTTVINLHLFHQ